jgi:hypothetical protein
MKSELLESHLPGGHGASARKAAGAPAVSARLAAHGYTFIMAGGAKR